MANTFRYRFGDRQLVKVAVASATVIERGDMVCLASDLAIPISSITWDTDLATTQGAAAAAFAGIAVDASAAGEDDDINIDISPVSVYEMDCASATFYMGDPVGPAKQTGNALEDQKVIEAVAAASIGRVYRSAASTTKVLCTFASAKNGAANNVNGALG